MSGVPAPVLVVSGPSGAGKTAVARLVAAAFESSVHIQADAYTPFVVNGWVEPWLPEAARQNDVLGGAIAAAALEFAVDGYTVVLDGHVFPEAVGALTRRSARRGVPVYYAVLRPNLETCLRRVSRRRAGDPGDQGTFARLHARYSALGTYETHVVDATGTPEGIASAVLEAISSERLRVNEASSPRQARPTSTDAPDDI